VTVAPIRRATANPVGHEHCETFTRKADAERFLREVHVRMLLTRCRCTANVSTWPWSRMNACRSELTPQRAAAGAGRGGRARERVRLRRPICRDAG
jgi:hypothetical protein